MTFARDLETLKSSGTAAVLDRMKELEEQGAAFLNLGMGQPDFPTPEPIREHVKAFLDQGYVPYTEVTGSAKLRAALARSINEKNGARYEPSEIMTSAGAKFLIFAALRALVNPGDEVVIPHPYYTSYPDITLLVGGVPRILHTAPQSGWKIQPSDLPKTGRVLVLNSPSNPTGMAYSQKEFDALVLRARELGMVVISDEVYDAFRYTKDIGSLTRVPDAKGESVYINSFSKTYAMTGWRIGYAAAPEALISRMSKIQSQTVTQAPVLGEQAALAALEHGGSSLSKAMFAEFAKRKDAFARAIRANNLSVVEPDGAFYFFVYAKDGDRVASDLLLEHHIAVVPGSAFGAPEYVRVSISAPEEQLERCASALGLTVARTRV